MSVGGGCFVLACLLPFLLSLVYFLPAAKEKSIYPSGNFPFQGLKCTFQGLKRTFQGLKRAFQALERKIVQGPDEFLPLSK